MPRVRISRTPRLHADVGGEEILPQNHSFYDFEVEYDFPKIGRRTMLLNARRVRGPTESRLTVVQKTAMKSHGVCVSTQASNTLC